MSYRLMNLSDIKPFTYIHDVATVPRCLLPNLIEVPIWMNYKDRNRNAPASDARRGQLVQPSIIWRSNRARGDHTPNLH